MPFIIIVGKMHLGS